MIQNGILRVGGVDYLHVNATKQGLANFPRSSETRRAIYYQFFGFFFSQPTEAISSCES